MITRSESSFKTADGTRIFFQRWTTEKPKANLVITHGQAEHSGCYHRLIKALEPLNLDIIAWDLRGHGRSSGLRGYARAFQDYVDDFEAFLKLLTLEMGLTKRPIGLLGHSMGGLIQLKLLCDHPDLPISTQVLSGPMCGIAVDVPAYKEKAAHLIELVAPKITLGNEIKFTDLTHETETIREYENDTLRHDRISAGVYLGSLRTMSQVRAMVGRVKTPTLLQMAEHDPITSTPAALEIFSRLGSEKKEKILYPGRKHEIYNDTGNEEVFTDLRNYLSANLV